MLKHLLLLLCLTAAAQATVVNFDDLSGEGLVPDGYGGINWGGAWTHYDQEQDPYFPQSPAQRVYPTNNEPTALFSFVNPDRVFQGAWFSGFMESVSFRLFNDGMLVHTSSSLVPTAAPGFLASGYGGPVDEVEVVSAANFWVMDDVTYDATVVPEPASVCLIGAGAVGLFVVRRRK
jgi:hypothetical protein